VRAWVCRAKQGAAVRRAKFFGGRARALGGGGDVVHVRSNRWPSVEGGAASGGGGTARRACSGDGEGAHA
jgi:hypothetical protein